MAIDAPTVRGGPVSSVDISTKYAMLEGEGDMDLLRPLGMGIISLVELFVRRGDTCERTEPSTILHRPTEGDFNHPRHDIPEVAQ